MLRTLKLLEITEIKSPILTHIYFRGPANLAFLLGLYPLSIGVGVVVAAIQLFQDVPFKDTVPVGHEAPVPVDHAETVPFHDVPFHDVPFVNG